MENNLIKQAWELAEHDIDYQNYQENMMLLEGRSGEHFKDVIMKRVKLKYANGNFSSEDMRNWTIPTAYGKGLRALKKDYDKETLKRIKSLMEYDVEFIACKNTMETMKWKESDFIDDISFTQAGIVEVIERQVDGYIGITAY